MSSSSSCFRTSEWAKFILIFKVSRVNKPQQKVWKRRDGGTLWKAACSCPNGQQLKLASLSEPERRSTTFSLNQTPATLLWAGDDEQSEICCDKLFFLLLVHELENFLSFSLNSADCFRDNQTKTGAPAEKLTTFCTSDHNHNPIYNQMMGGKRAIMEY